jgi:hypothetical protein
MKTFYGRKFEVNGKERTFIEVIKTKIGNGYIALRTDRDGVGYAKYVPLDRLIEFCDTFEESRIMTDEEIERAKLADVRLLKAIKNMK